MRLIRVLAVLAALALVPAVAALAQDSTTTRAPAARTPHRTLNKEDCLSCHRQGNTQRIAPVPATHDYTNERCMRCHRAAATMPSRSEHAFDSRHARCAECHVAGNTVHAQPTPASHARYTAAMCVMCHEPQAAN
jgi:hypothetical protein